MSVADIEEGDFDYDLRVSRGLKRMRGDKQISRLNHYTDSVEFLELLSDVNVEDIDYDYLRFLRELSHWPAEDYDSDCNTDPHYKLFLENLREDGDSYILEIPAEDGSSVLIKYEEKRRVPVSCKKSRSFGKTISLGPLHSPNLKENHEIRSDEIDENYLRFLGCLEQRDDFMVFKPNDHEEFIYDKDEEGSSDTEIMMVDNSPFLDGSCTPFVSSKAYHTLSDEKSWDGVKTDDQSRFRERLMELVKKPYDAKEYTDLLRKVNEKKPVVRHIENRSGKVKCYHRPGPPGMSYLERYRDLAWKMKSVHDPCKKLQLLRAFFFWLENVVHNDQFIPWKDSSFLKMLL